MADPNGHFFKKLGISYEKASEMIAIAPAFFKYLVDNITDDNIVTKEEMKEYKGLEKAGKLHSDNELKRKLKEIDAEYPGISKCTKQDLEISKAELKKLKKAQKKQKMLLEKLEAREKTQANALAHAKIRLEDVKKESNVLIEETSKVARKLETVEKENQELVQKLHNNVNTPKTLTHHMSFFEHFNFIEEFIKELEKYCVENQILLNTSVIDENENELKLGKLQDAKDGLVNARYREIIDEMKIAAMEAVSREICSGSIVVPRNMDQLRAKMLECSEINEQKENQLLTLKNRLKESIDAVVLSQIEVLSAKNIKYKHDRATNRIENINQLTPFVTKTIQISEIIWFAINLDWERLNKDFSCVDFGANHATKMRIQVMKRLLKGNSVQKHLQTAQDQVIRGIADAVGMTNGNFDMRDIVYAYSDFKSKLSLAVSAVANGVAADDINNYLEELRTTEQILKKFVYGGCYSKPQLGDPRFTKKILKIRAKNEEMQTEYTEIKQDMKRMDEYYQKDKYARYGQALWIWFLSEPKKVLQAIQEVQKAASVPSPLHLSGLLRKQ